MYLKMVINTKNDAKRRGSYDVNNFWRLNVKKRDKVFKAERQIGYTLIMVAVVLITVVLIFNYSFWRSNIKISGDSIISLFISIVSLLMNFMLSGITVYHNIQMQRNHEQMQKFQQVQFVSMVSAKDISVKLDPKLKIENPEYYFDVTSKVMKESAQYDIAITFENYSDYPIVQMNIHMDQENERHESYGMIAYSEYQVYIAPHSTATYHILAPLRSFEEREVCSCIIEIDYINVYDYSTTAKINIPDFKKKEYSYRLKKVDDIKPTR